MEKDDGDVCCAEPSHLRMHSLVTIFAIWIMLVGTAAPDGPRAIVEQYFRGLAALDQEKMAAFLADPYVWHYRNQDRVYHPGDMRGVRQMERILHTHWKYRIVGVQGEEVKVEEIEDNDAYQLLGVGKRTKAASYFVRSGKIYRIDSAEYTHEHGDWHEVNRSFAQWLATQPPEDTARVLKGGEAVYSAASAPQLLVLMKRYRATLAK